MSLQNDLEEAIKLWTGWTSRPMPVRDDQIIIERYGPERGTATLGELKRLESEFYASDARHRADTLAQMEELAGVEFRTKYPSLPETISRAFAWCYAWDYK